MKQGVLKMTGVLEPD